MPSVSRATVAPRCDQKRYNLGFSKPIISVRKCVIQMSLAQFQYSVPSPLATNTYVTDTSIQRGFKDTTQKLESIKMKINDKKKYWLTFLGNTQFRSTAPFDRAKNCRTHWIFTVHIISGTFAELRKATISFVTSVCLPASLTVRVEQLDSQWTDFD